MLTVPECALKGWHPGEQAVQKIIHLPERVSIKAIVNKLPEQHRIFHTSRLHFLPVTTLDDQGRPWASILCSLDGTPAFISSPTDTSLHVKAHLWPGDPISDNFVNLGPRQPLASGIGIEVATRRRNKFAGRVSDVTFNGLDISLHLSVDQALGLCPKYINIRVIRPFRDAVPRVLYQNPIMDHEECLPDDVISFIHEADTAYIATSYVAPAKDEETYPSRVGTNHRGGRPGFMRVRPNDRRTIVLPNYGGCTPVFIFTSCSADVKSAGNRMMNSLGNIYITPLAGLVIPSFSTGSVLYVTGEAETKFGEAAQRIMPHANIITTIRITGFTFVENALPLREDPGVTERSPYSPPVRYLANEQPPTVSLGDVILTLMYTRLHSSNLATLTFRSSRTIDVRPTQNCVLDLSDFLRVRSHELIEWEEDESTENDDCIRTWTISELPTKESPHIFSLTMRAINGGLITPILYQIAKNADPNQSGTTVDVSGLNIMARLRGIGGDLPVPEPISACDGGRRLLWIAGGIGLTPFLSLTRHVSGLAKRSYGVWDIVLVLSTREAEIMIQLILEALEPEYSNSKNTRDACFAHTDLTFSIHIFSPSLVNDLPPLPPFVTLITHVGRLDDSGKLFGSVDAKFRECQICGPLPFVQTAMHGLEVAGVDPERVKRERFTY
ncbi:hypothetical protein BJ138DRAFT_1115608 [Hygrophoropsis aurantiaca]|uniref:Uncharacterized protein n=1 Tax=Hygrophoropsis aurantiaca TaxID=72124 RepID=A0ACB8A6P4_9AGAM|nr:hypothetical protein BJ138DRAFT_1115608 [Hygrophoropsis aurantiaca]